MLVAVCVVESTGTNGSIGAGCGGIIVASIGNGSSGIPGVVNGIFVVIVGGLDRGVNYGVATGGV